MAEGNALGFGIVGAGNIGALHAQAIRHLEGARLVAVSDLIEERAKALAGPAGAAWYTDYGEMLRDRNVDVVNICTASGLHGQMAVAAAQAGKHVIVEKPMEITVERADEIIDACRENGVKLAVIFQYRFGTGVQKAKEAVGAGRLGQLTLCDAYVKWYRTQEYYDTGGWRGTWAMDGGGALMNQSIHTIDLLQWLAGPVESVYAYTATLAHRMETEDTAVVLVEFRDGALGVIEGATSTYPGQPSRVELSGDKGTIVLEDGIVTRWDLADASPEEEEAMLRLEVSTGTGASEPMGISYHKHQRQIEDFVAAVWKNRSPLVDGIEGRKAVAIIQAIYQSAETGQAVRLVS